MRPTVAHRRLAVVLPALLLAVLGVQQQSFAQAIASPTSPAVTKEAEDKVVADPLPQGAVRRFGTPRLRTGARITRLALSDDGKYLATVSRQQVQLWSLRSGRIAWEHEGSEIAFSPGSRYLAYTTPGPSRGSGNSQYRVTVVRVCETASGREVATLGDPSGSVTGIAWIDGKKILLALSQTMKAFEIPSGNAVLTLPSPAPDRRYRFGRYGTIDAMFPSAAADAVICGHSAAPMQGVVTLWRLSSPELRRTLDGDGGVLDVRFPDKSTAMLALWDEHHERPFVAKWDISPQSDAKGLDNAIGRHSGRVVPAFCARFSPDGKQLAISVTPDESGHSNPYWWNRAELYLVDVASSMEKPLEGTCHAVDAVAYSADGKNLVAGGKDGVVRGWDVRSRKTDLLAGEPAFAAFSAALSPDGRMIAVGDADGEIRLSDLRSGKLICRLPGQKAVLRLAFSANGKRLASLCGDGTLRVWDMDKHSQELEIKSRNAYGIPPRGSLAWSADGAYLAMTHGQNLVVLDLHTQEAVEHPETKLLNELRGKIVFYARDTVYSSLSVADLGGELLKNVRWGSQPVTALAPDGKRQAVANEDQLYLLGLPEKKTVCTLAAPLTAARGQRRIFRDLAFSPDGKKLAAVQDATPDPTPHGAIAPLEVDQIVHVWDLDTMRHKTFRGHRGPIQSLAFDGSGRWLITCGADTTVLVWDLAAKTAAPPAKTGAAQLVAAMQGQDEETALAAMRVLANRPKDVLGAAQTILRGGPDDPAVARLIAQLGSSTLSDRARAITALAKLRETIAAVESMLVKTVLDAKTAPAVRRRACDLLEPLGQSVTESRTLRLRVVRLLQWTGDEASVNLLKALSALPENRGGAEASAALEAISARTNRSDFGAASETRPAVSPSH